MNNYWGLIGVYENSSHPKGSQSETHRLLLILFNLKECEKKILDRPDEKIYKLGVL